MRRLNSVPRFQGFDSGIYTIIIAEPAFVDEFNLNGARSGVVASMINLGNVIGNLFVAWWFIWLLGRKRTFALGTVVLLVGVALQAGARAYAMIVVGRIVAGIGTATIGTNLAAYQVRFSWAKYEFETCANCTEQNGRRKCRLRSFEVVLSHLYNCHTKSEF